MLKIIPLSAFEDNYIWLVQSKGEAVVIDAGQAEPVLDYLKKHHLKLAQIWVTHPHNDHIDGIAALKKAYPDWRVLGAGDIIQADEVVDEGSQIVWQKFKIDVWRISGHCANHLGFLLPENAEQVHFFCGDVLFSGGCGRVFPDGDIHQLYRSLQRINTLPENTLLYPAHEYTESNLEFAEHIEPKNADIQAAQVTAWYTPTLPVTLSHERRINPFLRLNEPRVQESVRELTKQNLVSDEAIFIALRTLKNIF